MDTVNHDHNESETSPFQDMCPRHGTKVHRHHGCPKCVMEEVRRHESRIHLPLELEQDAPLELEHDAPIEFEHESAIELQHDAPIELEHDVPIPADPLGNIDPLSIEIV